MSDICAVLEAAANQILAVVAPATARLVRARVWLDEQDDSASTDGVRIWLPAVFEGVEVGRDTPLALGLLVHELGHFLQPLEALAEAEREAGAPHWLGNVVADIQLEAMMASLFPPLAHTLVAVRAQVRQARLAEYVEGLHASRDLAEIANPLALAGRFARPEVPFDDPYEEGSQLEPLLQFPEPLRSRGLSFARWLSRAQEIAAQDLPDFLRQLMEKFPELRQAGERYPVPGGRSAVAAAGKAAQAEAAANAAALHPTRPMPVAMVPASSYLLRPEARQIARGLRIHFQAAGGATEIVAPGRLERRAAALGELIPLRLQLPGRERPRPRVVIGLDRSSSMKGADKFAQAQIAAQAVALAVQEAGGEVVGILFDDTAQVADTGDAALLFSDPATLTFGGTSFEFLGDAWRRWPEHLFLLVTDGNGPVPPALPGDRARTAVILIPPDCDEDAMRQIAARVVVLRRVRSAGLASVLTMLTPR